ncbi:MAG: TonB-dependent receptor [Gammaproteobacteria bacterium]|nr:TonB-dependent receptor [Gammaproteobacteria bacterium]
MEPQQTALTRRRRQILCSLAPVVLLLSLLVQAADAETSATPELSEDAFIGELPIVLTATRLAQPKSETPAAITVIDRDMIRASGARQIPELFRFVPGFQIGYSNGHLPTVTYHGLSDENSRRMQVLIDGRSIYSPLFGGVFWYELPLAVDDIERIEVIRGPNAATYGANAVHGVINIITRHPSQDVGSFVKINDGGHDIFDGTVRYGTSGPNHHTRVTAGYRADDGIDGRPDTSRVPFVNARSDLLLDNHDSLELQFGASEARAENGISNDTVSTPRDTEANTSYQLLRWSRRLAADQELAIQLFHNYRKYDDNFLAQPLNLGPPIGIVRVPVSFDSFEERYDLELQHTLQPFDDWRLVWGAGTRLDRVRSQTWFNTGDTIENHLHRFFANAEWHALPQTFINAGAMVEKTDLTDTEVSPRLALNHHLTPQHTLRLAASKAARTPVLLEVRGDEKFFYNGLLLEHNIDGNENLASESMESYEAGYLGQLLANRLLIDVRIYRDRLHHMITEYVVPAADPEGQAFSFRNEGDVIVDGIDTQIDWHVDTKTRLSVGLAYMDADSSVIGADAVRNQTNRASSVPRHTISLLASHQLADAWSGSVAYYRVDDMLWMGDGDQIEDYARVDLRLAHQLRCNELRGELALVVQNALDNEYVDFREENIIGRRVFVSFSAQLH